MDALFIVNLSIDVCLNIFFNTVGISTQMRDAYGLEGKPGSI